MSETTDQRADGADAGNPHAATVRKLADAMLRTAVWPGVVVVLLGILVSGLLAGLPGVFGALVGGVVAFGSSLLTIGLMRWTGGLHPMFVMVAALGGYMGKMLVLLVVMTLLGGVEGLHSYALAFTMLATIIVWAASEVVAFRKTKIPVVVPGQ
ncbi:MAG: hypothetical protein IJH84_22840 [Saccharopolyspora sp.]|uniref:hypothetical protein n=1 Tax=Saccharopolyspora TaxID=1835 RepID=UPI00190D3499|nr:MULTISPECIES: hypothetical protein [unclassified Saccharopolyspora]MBK0867639.1 hypothetical protein [Saccharopolyspora sp. HNM0986]MBQ6643851.1 hypothetical protein [Saccharopolyspora sp.]